jgi:hypothetical protein
MRPEIAAIGRRHGGHAPCLEVRAPRFDFSIRRPPMAHPRTREHHLNLVALALASASALAACGEQPPPPEPVVEEHKAPLSAAAVQSGGGVLWHLPNGDVYLWDMLDDSNFRAFNIGNGDRSTWKLETSGDVDGNGSGDIIFRSQVSLSAWLMTDTRKVGSAPETFNVPTRAFYNATIPLDPVANDIDGDGVTDLVWDGKGTVDTQTWFLKSGTTTPKSTVNSNGQDEVLAVADLDNDAAHKADVVRHRLSDGMITIDYNQGGQTNMEVVGWDWHVMGTGDFNGDKAADILWYNASSGTVHVWLMKPGAKTTLDRKTPGVVTLDTGWEILGVGDFNHDGIADILWKHYTGVAAVWQMSSSVAVAHYGSGLTIPTDAIFGGVINIGAPEVPGNVVAAPGVVVNGTRTLRAKFTVPLQRLADQEIEVWEMVGSTPTFRTRTKFFFDSSPNTARLEVPTSLFASANPCIKIKAWEQGRVSAFSPQVCLSMPNPTVSVDWTMPARFGLDANGDKAIDLTPSSDSIVSLRSNTWSVNLNACASSDAAAGGTIARYKWTGPNSTGTALTQLAPEGPGCTITALLPGGHQFVTVDATTADGRVGTFTLDVNVKNTNIVLMGDSFMSGEANPLAITPALWGTDIEANCHRTANTAAARAALALERSDPRSSVTFTSVACTGAVMENIASSDLTKGQWGQPPQIIQVKRTLCGYDDCRNGIPKIQALVFDGGINDLGFSSLLTTCALFAKWYPVTYPNHCHDDPFTVRDEQSRLDKIASWAPWFADVIQSLGASAVYTGDYPNPGSSANGTLCGNYDLSDGGPANIDFNIPGDDVSYLTQLDSKLNNSLRGTYTLSKYHFNFLDYGSLFYKHGYCSSDHWYQHADESKIHQGNTDGTMHPNDYGHVAVGQKLLGEFIKENLGPANATSYFPYQTFVRPWESTTRYDWGTQCTVSAGSVSQTMHCCPTGWAMTGLRATDHDLLRCNKVTGTLAAPTLDTSTVRTVGGQTMHTCPVGSVMVGFHRDSNRFACAKPATIGAESLDRTTQDIESNNGIAGNGYPVHVCPPGQTMVGTYGEAAFACSKNVILN